MKGGDPKKRKRYIISEIFKTKFKRKTTQL
jgi:hypothetical protein